jgi:hypothetical protein
MAKLETQINQIFLSPTESKKLSLILFEEKISAAHQLFLIAELRDIQRKTELNDLGKISEIIIESFKANRKLSGEAMFESTLADINNKLGEFAHKGRKSWLGKFSALVAVKSEKDFFLANTGHTSAWLKRKNSLNEILSQDKAETHPLKTFLNFSSGRLMEGDNLILTTSSIFNYVSVELFSKTLSSNSLTDACAKISAILKSSAKSDEGFAVFMLNLARQIATSPKVELIAPPDKPELIPEPAAAAGPSAGIYAPLPEDLDKELARPTRSLLPSMSFPSLPAMPTLKSLPRLSLPKLSLKLPDKLPRINFKLPNFRFLPNISGPAKFFLASFVLFAILFTMNIAAYGVQRAQSRQDEKFNASTETLVTHLSEAESALLYKNQSQAMKLMSDAETELHKLEQIDIAKAGPFQNKFDEMNNRINRVTILRNVSPAFEMPYSVNFMARAGAGYLVANENPNSLGIFTDDTLKNIFMLNKIDGDVRGIAHVSGLGNYVASKDKIYRVNESRQEFEQVNYSSNADFLGLKFLDPNRIFAINKTTNQVVRMNVSGGGISGITNILKSNVNFQDAQDLAADTDIYVLFPDRLAKFVNGNQVDFPLTPISEPAKQMTKMRVGNQIYLLEPTVNRVLIYNRRGELLNQVQFPALSDLKDIYVDETKHEMLLVNGNKVYRITF